MTVIEAASAGFVLALSVGCSIGEADQLRVVDEKVLIPAIEQSFIATLRDPTGVLFRDVYYFWLTSTLCGEVNEKNVYGGYTGFVRFFAQA